MISGDLSLYLGMEWGIGLGMSIRAKDTLEKIEKQAMAYLVEAFQGYANITEEAYCQVGVRVCVEGS